ncbi:MAG: hypothetical protein J1E62_02760 [Lachnospiraceae bacterium]|nr:hypothetical protein [Lachnospiraceae bacterium]
MRVIEGRQIATDTKPSPKVVNPIEIQTTRGVTHPTEVQVLRGVTRPAQVQIMEEITHPTEVETTRTLVHPAEIQTTKEIPCRIQKLRDAHTETMSGSEPMPINTEPVDARELQTMIKPVKTTTNTQNVQSVSVKPHMMEVRNGQKEMTLEELFTTGRKEEQS